MNEEGEAVQAQLPAVWLLGMEYHLQQARLADRCSLLHDRKQQQQQQRQNKARLWPCEEEAPSRTCM